jgi:hypothetical protein
MMELRDACRKDAMEATQLLTADHNRVRGMFARYNAAHEAGDGAEAVPLAAPTVTDKLVMTKAELDEMARTQQIPGRSTMNHEELAATVGLE